MFIKDETMKDSEKPEKSNIIMLQVDMDLVLSPLMHGDHVWGGEGC